MGFPPWDFLHGISSMSTGHAPSSNRAARACAARAADTATFETWARTMGIVQTGVKLLLGASLAFAVTSAGAETPKRGGVLTYMIPADAGPSLDGHRETTYAVVHATAPFYSVLIRVNPDNPSSPTDFVCDLCTQMPEPTDNGLTYTFKIRPGVEFHDGSPLTAHDIVASFNKIIFPPEGTTSASVAFSVM